MSPKRIVERAMSKMLDLIGICDHNSAENVQYTINAANLICRDSPPITVLPGMEICTKEEVHIFCLFDNAKQVLKLQEMVYSALPKEKNNPELFGEQIIANEYDEVEGYNERLLIGATNLGVQEVINQIHNLNGIAIASHIDRASYSLIGQLGFIPEDLEIDAVEISTDLTVEDAHKKFPEIKRYPVIRSSDAHYLEDIGKATTNFYLPKPTLSEIKKALRNEDGRKMVTV